MSKANLKMDSGTLPKLSNSNKLFFRKKDLNESFCGQGICPDKVQGSFLTIYERGSSDESENGVCILNGACG